MGKEMGMNANYGGGKMGGFHKGMKTHSPPVNDKSNRPIGDSHPNVSSGATRNETAVADATIGPRTA